MSNKYPVDGHNPRPLIAIVEKHINSFSVRTVSCSFHRAVDPALAEPGQVFVVAAAPAVLTLNGLELERVGF